jgi:hypothetical protein
MYSCSRFSRAITRFTRLSFASIKEVVIVKGDLNTGLPLCAGDQPIA